MRVAVVSDIHSNFHALEAVLEAIDSEAPDELWCLGDVVGYGPRPNECCALVAERADICLAGNHDLAIVGTIDLDEFHGDAALPHAGPQSADAGVARLSRPPRAAWQRARRRALPRQRPGSRVGIRALRRGGVRDAGDCRRGARARRTQPRRASFQRAGRRPRAGRHDRRVRRRAALLNPGSVGQPRDGDPRAAYLLLDLVARRAEFRRVEYDVARTQSEMAQAGLPGPLAARLALGQ